jgi:hypothetical protein
VEQVEQVDLRQECRAQTVELSLKALKISLLAALAATTGSQ